MEEVIADLCVVCKAAHPICVDRRMRSGRIGNMRLYELDVVRECHDVKEVTLGLSYKDDYVTKCQRVVEKEYSVVFKQLEHLAANVLLVATSLPPCLVTASRQLTQGGNTGCFSILSLPTRKAACMRGSKSSEEGRYHAHDQGSGAG